MLPDFPAVKKRARMLFLRAVRQHIPIHSPILDGIRHTRIHEGSTARLTRADKSTDEIKFQGAHAEIAVDRAQMRCISLDDLIQHASKMAEQLAEQQTKAMFERLNQAIEAVGNTVSAQELGAKEAFLEMERKIQMDFDPVTLEPKGLALVLHPDQVESMKAQADEWSRDPEFVAERKRIRQAKLEEWRARENRRTLAD
jgi:hypothetical protein